MVYRAKIDDWGDNPSEWIDCDVHEARMREACGIACKLTDKTIAKDFLSYSHLPQSQIGQSKNTESQFSQLHG